jgi:hypothetical protein
MRDHRVLREKTETRVMQPSETKESLVTKGQLALKVLKEKMEKMEPLELRVLWVQKERLDQLESKETRVQRVIKV